VRHPIAQDVNACYLGAGDRPIKQARGPLAGSTAIGAPAVIFRSAVLPPAPAHTICIRMRLSLKFWASGTMPRRLLKWRIMLALFFCASVALAPAIVEARAGGRSSSMGSRGLRTYENNSAQPLGRSMSPAQTGLGPGASSPAYGGGSFFQRHPFMTGLAGGFIGSWLFGHSGYAADGTSGGSAMGILLEILIFGALIYFAVRLFRGRAFSNGWPGGTPFSMARSAGASAAPVRRNRGRDINLSDTELSESWDEGDLQYATAYMRWRAIDYVTRLGRPSGDPDSIVSGNPRVAVEAEEVWTFVRRRGGDWLLSAIQQV